MPPSPADLYRLVRAAELYFGVPPALNKRRGLAITDAAQNPSAARSSSGFGFSLRLLLLLAKLAFLVIGVFVGPARSCLGVAAPLARTMTCDRAHPALPVALIG